TPPPNLSPFITNRAADVLFVPAKVRDNPGVVPEEYEAGMQRVPEELRKRLLEGDWDVFEGMAFPDWNPEIHVVPEMPIPVEWERFESFDHGTTNPSCLLGFAVDYEGNVICFDSHYSPGLPSFQAAAIKAKREL